MSIGLLSGTAVNLETPLVVRQDGHPEIEIGARYSTRPLAAPFYYALRLSFERAGGAWEVQLIHHKLHLSNPPDQIQHFEITHGFNLLTVNRAVTARDITLRIGAGVVLAHTESTIRGGADAGNGGVFGTGFRLTGPSCLVGVGKELALTPRFSVGAEVELSAAWARVPVAEGTATAPNVGLHLLLGARYRF